MKPTPERLREVTRRLELLRSRRGLSLRQADVLCLIVQGLANKDIASRLRCSEVNVESHMTALLRRTQSSSRAMLVARFWLEFDLAAEDQFEMTSSATGNQDTQQSPQGWQLSFTQVQPAASD